MGFPYTLHPIPLRKMGLLFLILIFGNLNFSAVAEDVAFFKQVTSYNGAKFRESPGLNSAVIRTLEYGTTVRFIDWDNHELIDGNWGYWAKVEFDGKIGFIFGPLLDELTTVEDDFLHSVYLIEKGQSERSDNFIFVSNSLKMYAEFKNYYAATYEAIVPKGQDGDTPRLQYIVCVQNDGKFIPVFEKNSWFFSGLKLADVNDDGKVDIVGTTFGPESPDTIEILLNTDDGMFSSRNNWLTTSAYEFEDGMNYRSEQFYYNSHYEMYAIRGGLVT